METYKSKLIRCGVHVDFSYTKKERKKYWNEYVELLKQQDLFLDEKNINKDEAKNIRLKFDDLKRFINFKNRLPSEEEVSEINKFHNFKFWLNYHMNADDFNNAFVWYSPINKLYNSL